MNENYNRVSEIASKHLGQVGGAGYKDTYSPDLLVAIPRQLNRVEYGIEENRLPFVGYDVWNAYEFSTLTKKGLPVSGMLKLSYSAESIYHVESKSLKLYLNSFNMSVFGDDTEECIALIERKISKDLHKLLGVPVSVSFFSDEENESFEMIYPDISTLIDLDAIDFTDNDGQLKVYADKAFPEEDLYFKTNLLRSNCRVTNQPDWGDLYVYIEGPELPDLTSFAKYVVSHRKVNHFHEEIVEMVYTDLMRKYSPSSLMVCALYTRRGGIDINPIRATGHLEIPFRFHSPKYRLTKTLRQ